MSTEEGRGEMVTPPAAPQTTGDSESQMITTRAPTGGEGKAPEVSLEQELRELGKQIQALLFTVRSDPRTKEIEVQVTSAMRDAERQVAEALSTLRKEFEAGKVQEKVKGTAAGTAEQMETGLARGLHGINQRMAKFVQETEDARSRREAGISREATSGTADNEVADRFGDQAPVFGEGMHVPSPGTPPEPLAPQAGGTSETLVTERFDDKPVDFSE